MTSPMKAKEKAVVTQRFNVKGFKKSQAFLLLSLNSTTIDTLDSEYGNVKSTFSDLLSLMDTSPTTASYTYSRNGGNR